MLIFRVKSTNNVLLIDLIRESFSRQEKIVAEEGLEPVTYTQLRAHET